jgi:hypothetical protein
MEEAGIDMLLRASERLKKRLWKIAKKLHTPPSHDPLAGGKIGLLTVAIPAS